MVAQVIQLHQRRTQAQKTRARDEVWRKRIANLRQALREQWQVEEARYLAEIKELRGQVAELVRAQENLTNQVFRLAQETMEKDSGAIIKEMADFTVRITQGDNAQVPGVNLTDVISQISGEEQPETVGGGLFVPEHELDILAWANDAMPTRGGWYNNEKAAGAKEPE